MKPPSEWHLMPYEIAAEFQKNIYSASLTTLKPLYRSQQIREILKVMGIPDHLTCLLRNLYAGQGATVPDMEQRTGSKVRQEYVKAVYCRPPYLTSMQSTSCKMLGWMNHKLELRLPGEISTTTGMQLVPL